MPTMAPPTTPKGVTGSGAYSAGLGWGGAYDQLEHVQDLQWPLSIRTFARMRHDPTLASVLAAYRLPILNARWEIDPRGASPAIVQACADSLGIPVRGAPEDPGPARRRGVQWLHHLRSALGVLTYGHAAFEPVFDLSTGVALLAALGERTQLSIAEIEVDDQGDLTQITQYGDITKPSPPPLKAGLLLWYVRDREGANWTGQSLLRPAFGSWLLKQDALRAGGTAVRRFAAGTPSVEWDPGTNPTAAQMAAAQAVASNVRGGDSAGVAMPTGAHLRIVGVSGTYPDAIPLIHYHDQQMARSALTSMLDLGNTSNGSRALGGTFADLLCAAQQGTAEQLAETATELCVRITDYNEGETATAPAVVVGDVGGDRQAVAQAISLLVQAGAITRDDDLENWLRDAYDAPTRTTPTPPTPAPPAPAAVDPGAGGPGGAPPAPGPAVTASARPVLAEQLVTPAEPVTPTGTMPVGRDLTQIEQDAGVDPQEADDEHAALLAALLAAWLLIRSDQDASLVEQVTTALTGGGIPALGGLTLDTRDAATVLGAAMLEAADAGVRLATAEAAAQGVTITGAVVDAAAVEATATALADVLGQATAAAAARQAVALAAAGAAPADVAAGVEQYLTDLPSTWTDTQMGAVVHGGMGAGRAAVITAGPPARIYASEVRDLNICAPCLDLDGTEFADMAAALEVYPMGWYVHCLGRERCRGQAIAVYQVTSP